MRADVTSWEPDILALIRQTQVPDPGKIADSPSISVELTQQGNLLRQTEPASICSLFSNRWN